MIELRNAMVAICDYDSGAGSLSTLLGHTAGGGARNLVHWSDLRDEPASGIAYLIVSDGTNGSDRETRLVRVRFTIWAKTLVEIETLRDRLLRVCLTSNNLWAPPGSVAGVDAAPLDPFSELDTGELEDPRAKRKRKDVEVTFEIMKP